MQRRYLKHLIWIPMILSLLCLFLLNHHPRKVTLKNGSKQFSTSAEEQTFVNTWYAATNEVYFDNKLPKDTAIQIHVIPPDATAAYTIGQTTPLGNGQYLIELDPRFNLSGNQEALTLDHEMCHIYLDQKTGDGDRNHGPRFQACMQRLAVEQAFADLW